MHYMLIIFFGLTTITFFSIALFIIKWFIESINEIRYVLKEIWLIMKKDKK